MRVYKKKTIRRMKWYGVILVLSGIPLGIGRGENIFIRRKSDLCAEIVPSAFFLSERTGIRKGRDLQTSTSCVDAVGRISGGSDRKKGKGRTGGSIGR
jgi:hypothetical protein